MRITEFSITVHSHTYFVTPLGTGCSHKLLQFFSHCKLCAVKIFKQTCKLIGRYVYRSYLTFAFKVCRSDTASEDMLKCLITLR